MVAVYIYAGLRREEALWLTADDVRLRDGLHGMIRAQAKTIDGDRWQPNAASAPGLRRTCLDDRHTFGSQLTQNNVSLYKIATLLGNSPEICRQHSAVLVFEAMAGEMEFARHPQGTISEVPRCP